MNKKDNETERLEAEQSLYEHYWFDWYYGGRDRNAMIRWLKGNPHHVLEHHVDDLIRTLPSIRLILLQLLHRLKLASEAGHTL